MFGERCWDLVHVDGWFWKFGGVYCVPVDCVAVDLWFGGLCYVVVVVLIFETVCVGDQRIYARMYLYKVGFVILDIKFRFTCNEWDLY